MTALPWFIKQLWCLVAHRKQWVWWGHGDWRIQECRKCDDKWVVMAHQVQGDRVAVPDCLKEPDHDAG